MNKKLKILRLYVTASETSSPLNNFTIYSENRYLTKSVVFFNQVEKFGNLDIEYAQGSIYKYFKILNRIRFEEYDIIHIHSVQTAFLFIIVSILKLDIKSFYKSIFTVHNSFQNYHLRNRLLYYFTILFIKNIVFCSSSSKNSFDKCVLKPKKAFVIQNGINTLFIDSIKETTHTSNKTNIYFVGRFVESKHPEILLKVIDGIDSNLIDFHLFGDGPLKTKLETKYKKENIFFHGQVKRSTLISQLKKSGIFISLSSTEGLPMAVLESLYTGSIPILSKIPPHKEIIYDEKYFLPVGVSELDLKNKILTFIENKHLLLSEINEIKKNIFENFSLAKMQNEYHELYIKII